MNPELERIVQIAAMYHNLDPRVLREMVVRYGDGITSQLIWQEANSLAQQIYPETKTSMPASEAGPGEQGPMWANGHKGRDYSVPEGTPLLSVDSGLVEGVGEDQELGRFVSIKHPWGSVMYGHANQTLVTHGQEVQRGQRVAISGSTGKSTGPHVHIEASLDDGSLMDPADLGSKWLKDIPSRYGGDTEWSRTRGPQERAMNLRTQGPSGAARATPHPRLTGQYTGQTGMGSPTPGQEMDRNSSEYYFPFSSDRNMAVRNTLKFSGMDPNEGNPYVAFLESRGPMLSRAIKAKQILAGMEGSGADVSGDLMGAWNSGGMVNENPASILDQLSGLRQGMKAGQPVNRHQRSYLNDLEDPENMMNVAGALLGEGMEPGLRKQMPTVLKRDYEDFYNQAPGQDGIRSFLDFLAGRY